MISFKNKTLCALAMLAASIAAADVAQAAAVQASAMITDRTGTLLSFSSTNEYDVIATTKQQDDFRFGSVLPSVSLSDANGFSFAQVDNFWDPMPSTLAGAHDLGLATSSVIWSFDYTATGTGTAVLDLSFSALVDALNIGPGETAGGSALINVKRSGVQEAGAEAFYYLTGGGHTGQDAHLLYTFNAGLGDLGSFIITVSSQAVTSPVPVPAAVWLLGSALAGFGAMRRKRVQAA
jgi:hypothetical protein